MKDLFSVVSEENATPGNTIGMGNPVADDGSGKGTEPLPIKTAKAKKQKKHKKTCSCEEE